MDAKRPSIKESEVFYESCPGRNQYSLEIHGQGGMQAYRLVERFLDVPKDMVIAARTIWKPNTKAW